MPESNDPVHDELTQMRLRLDQLERDNQRLRETLQPFTSLDNPCFSPAKFQRAFSWIVLRTVMPVVLVALFVPLATLPRFRGYIPTGRIGPVPFVDIGGNNSGFYGLGLGIIAVGGGAVGVVAIGGFACGLLAYGGGAVGIVACGGGSVGVIAIGGGSLGYIAIGGGAVGCYALAGRGRGTHVLALNRQDQEAVDFFTRWFPSLRAAVTTAMPVIPISKVSRT